MLTSGGFTTCDACSKEMLSGAGDFAESAVEDASLERVVGKGRRAWLVEEDGIPSMIASGPVPYSC